MYTDVYTFIELLCIQMFTRLLYYYIVITDVYKFIELLYIHMFTHLLNCYIYICLHIY